jgi:hypothetical protein
MAPRSGHRRQRIAAPDPVIPAQAGIQWSVDGYRENLTLSLLDPGLRRDDEQSGTAHDNVSSKSKGTPH